MSHFAGLGAVFDPQYPSSTPMIAPGALSRTVCFGKFLQGIEATLADVGRPHIVTDAAGYVGEDLSAKVESLRAELDAMHAEKTQLQQERDQLKAFNQRLLAEASGSRFIVGGRCTSSKPTSGETCSTKSLLDFTDSTPQGPLSDCSQFAAGLDHLQTQSGTTTHHTGQDSMALKAQVREKLSTHESKSRRRISKQTNRHNLNAEKDLVARFGKGTVEYFHGMSTLETSQGRPYKGSKRATESIRSAETRQPAEHYSPTVAVFKSGLMASTYLPVPKVLPAHREDNDPVLAPEYSLWEDSLQISREF